MVPVNIGSFVFFLLGVLYMDLRVDQLILGNKADERVLGYAFTHYQISAFAEDWFKLILPTIIIIVFASIFVRIYNTRAAIDFSILFIFLCLGGMFAFWLVPTYDKMDEEFKASNVSHPFEFAYANQKKTFERLFFIANIHVIIIVVCITLLFFIKESYYLQNKQK